MAGLFSYYFRFLAQGTLLLLLFALILAYNVTDSVAQGCAMCRTVMPGANDPMARGLFWGVLILLTAPFLVVGAIGAWLYYHSRSSHRLSVSPAVQFPSARSHIQDQQ